MKKLFSALLCLLLFPKLLLAEAGGDLNLNNAARLASRTGYELTLGTQSTDDVVVIQNNIETLRIDGATGALTATGAQTILGDFTIKESGDANRLVSFTSFSDTGLQQKFGDAGVTAGQRYFINASTSDADDDSMICLGGGGDCSSGASGYTRGANALFHGNEHATLPGVAIIQGGGVSGADVFIRSEDDVILEDNAGTDFVVFDGTSSLFNNDIIQSAAGLNLLTGAASANADITARTTAEPKHLIQGAASVQSQLALVQAGVADSSAVELFAFKTRSTTGGDADTIISNGDGALNITAFGANGTTYDPMARIRLLSAAAPGAATDMPGKIIFETTPDGSATLATVLTLDQDKSATFTGAVTSSISTTIGWSVVDQTDNQACNTGCTSGCVFGIDNATGTAVTNLVSCAATTADLCVCAGAS